MFKELFWVIFGGGYTAGKLLSEVSQKQQREEYVRKQNFNMDREWELINMMTSADDKERAKFDELAGWTVNRQNWYDVHCAMKKISENEGWTYNSPRELSKDPEYRNVMSLKK